MPGEQTFHIGDGTLLAARMRDAYLRRRLSMGPAQWLAAVLGVVLGKKLPGTPKQTDADVAAWSRGVLTGLGYDPDTHELARRRHPVVGFVVRGPDGRPCQFISARELKKLAEDPLFMGGYAEEVKAT